MTSFAVTLYILSGSSLMGLQTGNASENVTQDVRIEYLRSFIGPGNLRWTAPPALEKALTIIAGPAEPSAENSPMRQPIAVVSDSRQRLVVADSGAVALHVFDFGGRRYWDLDLRKSGMRSIGDVAVDANSTIYVTDPQQGQVFIFSSKGKFAGHLQPRRSKEAYYVAPVGIAIDRDRGLIYVCDRDRNMVVVSNRSGRVLRNFGVRGGGSGPGDFRHPTHVALARGNIFILDAGNRRIQQLDGNGRFLGEIAISGAAGLSADSDNRIFISDPAQHRIWVYGKDGRLAASVGDRATDAPAIDPHGLWVDSNACLFVADGSNKRIDLYVIGDHAGKACDSYR